jgi:hypothetical protein
MFVAVTTKRSTLEPDRATIRDLWKQVDGGSGDICMRFVLCKGDDDRKQDLVAEERKHGDMLFLDCEEGYAKGSLTKKVAASFRAFLGDGPSHDQCLNRPLFMKVDDDTFVAGQRFRLGLSKAVASMGTETVFAGVDCPSQDRPIRDKSSGWYEPYRTWRHTMFPLTMYGGPGYILGRGLVQRIIEDGIADSHTLYNEDRAVGVWVDALNQRGIAVHWTRIPGTNGYTWDKPVEKGNWGAYPYALHHHLSKDSISCLMKLEAANDPNKLITPCFRLESQASHFNYETEETARALAANVWPQL